MDILRKKRGEKVRLKILNTDLDKYFLMNCDRGPMIQHFDTTLVITGSQLADRWKPLMS